MTDYLAVCFWNGAEREFTLLAHHLHRFGVILKTTANKCEKFLKGRCGTAYPGPAAILSHLFYQFPSMETSFLETQRPIVGQHQTPGRRKICHRYKPFKLYVTLKKCLFKWDVYVSEVPLCNLLCTQYRSEVQTNYREVKFQNQDTNTLYEMYTRCSNTAQLIVYQRWKCSKNLEYYSKLISIIEMNSKAEKPIGSHKSEYGSQIIKI